MANTPKVLIINAATGVEELRDMNAEELAQHEVDKAKDAEKQSAKASVEAKKQEVQKEKEKEDKISQTALERKRKFEALFSN